MIEMSLESLSNQKTWLNLDKISGTTDLCDNGDGSGAECESVIIYSDGTPYQYQSYHSFIDWTVNCPSCDGHALQEIGTKVKDYGAATIANVVCLSNCQGKVL